VWCVSRRCGCDRTTREQQLGSGPDGWCMPARRPCTKGLGVSFPSPEPMLWNPWNCVDPLCVSLMNSKGGDTRALLPSADPITHHAGSRSKRLWPVKAAAAYSSMNEHKAQLQLSSIHFEGSCHPAVVFAPPIRSGGSLVPPHASPSARSAQSRKECSTGRHICSLPPRSCTHSR